MIYSGPSLLFFLSVSENWTEIFLVIIAAFIFSYFFTNWTSKRDEKAIKNADHVRLFKRDARGNVQAYHAAWFETINMTILEHFGAVGTHGETVTHSRKLNISDREHIELLLAKSRQNLYSELAPEEFHRLTIQFKFDPNNKDKKKRARWTREGLRHEIDDELSWTGLGKSTNSKYTGDLMKIQFDVTDFDLAKTKILEILKRYPSREFEIVQNRRRRPIRPKPD